MVTEGAIGEWRERMASKKKMAAQKTKDASAAEPKELAERFAQKRRGEPEREAKLLKLRQQQSRHKGKIALEKVVIPYLQKVQDQFYETTTFYRRTFHLAFHSLT